MKNVREIDLNNINLNIFKKRSSGCLILTKDNKILLQERDQHCPLFPWHISTFGGHIEDNESPLEALIRELKEELEVEILPDEAIFLGTISKEIYDYKALSYKFFWHDKSGRLTDKCNEGFQKFFQNYHEVLAHPKLTDDIPWVVNRCVEQKYLN